ncbi:MAG: poly(R)-hydroxyalkanoic acid synthase subunit PhaE [Xanthomonadales bacterium]|nr:poly(R)-hydroxyalkanoic acid synthase subunit PhaE [Xanthomonadales bacterium]
MAEQGGGPDWLEKWQELQRGFWESLRELLARATPAAEDAVAARAGNGTLPWHEGLELWCRLYQPQEELGATVERVLARSRAFLGLLQRLAERSAAGEASEPAAIAGLVQDLFRAALPDPAGWLAAWSADRLADLERGLQPVAALQSALWGSARGELERWLSIQPLGLLREHQERRQALGRAALGARRGAGPLPGAGRARGPAGPRALRGASRRAGGEQQSGAQRTRALRPLGRCRRGGLRRDRGAAGVPRGLRRARERPDAAAPAPAAGNRARLARARHSDPLRARRRACAS